MIAISGLVFSWVDGVWLLVALLYAWQAYERGVVAVLNEMVAWVAAWWLAREIYQLITTNLVIYLGLKASLVRPWSFLITALVVQILIYRLLDSLTQRLPRHFFNKWAHLIIGTIPALICGACFASFILLVLIAMPFRFPFKTDLISSVVTIKLMELLPKIVLK